LNYTRKKDAFWEASFSNNMATVGTQDTATTPNMRREVRFKNFHVSLGAGYTFCQHDCFTLGGMLSISAGTTKAFGRVQNESFQNFVSQDSFATSLSLPFAQMNLNRVNYKNMDSYLNPNTTNSRNIERLKSYQFLLGLEFKVLYLFDSN
jgi:hypothetical protein